MTDALRRHFYKYILGTSKSCPNMAVYGETGEIPLSLNLQTYVELLAKTDKTEY